MLCPDKCNLLPTLCLVGLRVFAQFSLVLCVLGVFKLVVLCQYNSWHSYVTVI